MRRIVHARPTGRLQRRPSLPCTVPLPLLLLVALGLTALFPGLATAQVNVQPLQPEDPPPGVSGSVGGNLTVQTGNTDFVRLGVDARMYRVSANVTTLLVGNGGLGFLGSSRFASTGLFHYRRMYDVSPWASPEWYGQVNYDRSQLLRFRMVGGGGVRSPLVRGDWGHMGAATGLMVEDERLILPDTAAHASHTLVVRSSTYGTVRFSTDADLVITSMTYVQPKVGDWGDVRILQDMGLATSVTERLALTVSFDLRYDSRPPDGLAALDTRLRTGLTLTYGER